MEDIPLSQRRQMVRDAIERHGHKHFDMEYWITTKPTLFSHRTSWSPSRDDVTQVDPNHCGTTGCIAGHTLMLAKELKIKLHTVPDAAKFLGIEYCNSAHAISHSHPFSPEYKRWTQFRTNKNVWQEVLKWLDELVIEAQAEELTAKNVPQYIDWTPSESAKSLSTQ